MGQLSLALLGPPEVRHHGRGVTFPTRKTLALLAYLVVEGRSCSRDSLAALLWPESSQSSARATLRSTLARLRAALQESEAHHHLHIAGDLVAFDFASEHDLDVRLLEEAADRSEGLISELLRGSEACRGAFLEGFSLPDTAQFEHWVTLQRETWRQRMEVAFDRLAELQGERGQLEDALRSAARWLRLDPLNERAHRRLMQLHGARGDPAEAVRVYQAYRDRLQGELQHTPSPETEALAQRIRSAQGSEREVAAASPLRTVPAPLEVPLVGRGEEFAALVELYHRAAQGHPQVAVTVGEAGIGKTRLAREFLQWAAAEGADTVWGRAFETGGRLSYQPLVDALRPRVERENAPEDLLSDVWLVELSRLLPELRDRYPDLPAPSGEDAAARSRLLEAIARLGQALASRAPLVLFVDDLQWFDAASLDALQYVARRWTEGHDRILVITSVRAEVLEPSADLREWLARLRREVPLEELSLRALTQAETRELLLRWQLAPGDELDAFGGWLFAETGGHPFFLVETLKVLLDRGMLVRAIGPEGGWTLTQSTRAEELRRLVAPEVRQLIAGRLTRLSPASQTLAAAAAVVGQRFPFEAARQVAGLDEDRALAALDDLSRAYLVREAERGGGLEVGTYVFVHDRIHDAVYAEAGEARRQVFHRRALEGLQGRVAPAELVRHAVAAGLEGQALELAREAGGDAMSLLAPRDAVAHYTQAVSIAERLGRAETLLDLYAARGHAYVQLAMWAEARRDLEMGLIGLLPEQGERRAELLVDLMEACFWLLDMPAVRRQAEEGIGLAEATGRGDLETAAIGWLSGAESAEGNLRAAMADRQRALARARDLQLSVPPVVHTMGSLFLYWVGRLEPSAAASREAIASARSRHDLPVTMYSLPHLGLALAGTGRYQEALRVYEEARKTGREYAMEGLLARSIAMSAGLHLDLFDFEGAEGISQEARERALTAGFLPSAVSAGIDLLLNFARRGEPGRTEQLVGEVAEATERAAGFHGWLWRLRLAEARAEIAAAQEQWEEAQRWADEAIRQSKARGRVKYEAAGLFTLARSLAAQRKNREAMVYLRRSFRLARTLGDPALQVRVAAELMRLDDEATLVGTARSLVRRITDELPAGELREAFLRAEPVRLIARSG